LKRAATAGCGQLPAPLSSLWQPRGGPFQPPAAETIDPVSHVLNRLTFGASPGEYQRVRALAADPLDAARAFIGEQLAPETIEDTACDRLLGRFPALNAPLAEFFEYKEERLLREIVLATLTRATHSRRQLYEVMVHFWTDHFNIDPSKGDCRWLKAWDDREVIRRFALGQTLAPATHPLKSAWRFFTETGGDAPTPSFKFPDMLRASALSPAMLWYLDGRVNRRSGDDEKPNENYARELLELHTLGVHGGYSQKDVMEVARCLTGWTVRAKNKFGKARVEFKRHLHDDGGKEVLGHVIPAGLGPADLDRVLEIVGLHASTCRHLATKLCRRFIADEPGEAEINSVADAFARSGGDIRLTLQALFDTEAFWSARGTKFKRPFHFIVSALRATDARGAIGGEVVEYLERMGHVPFHYPTPDGYPEEPQPWLGTLLWRWNFAVALTEGRIDHQGPKVNPTELLRRAGSDEALMAHLLGRQPTADEIAAYHDSGAGLALCLASPAFQKC
jgi:uncharacterized protein (DUF1800 family)